MGKSYFGIVLKKVIGFILFIILLGIANFIGNYVTNSIYIGVLNFFNSNIILFFAILVFEMFSEILWRTKFPFNLLAPWFSALLGLIVSSFVFIILDILKKNLPIEISLPSALISWLIFWTIVFIGYGLVFLKLIDQIEKEKKKEKLTKGRRVKRKR